jgi:hypothetical protein
VLRYRALDTLCGHLMSYAVGTYRFSVITSKAVLILGRFSEDRKPVLDAIRD